MRIFACKDQLTEFKIIFVKKITIYYDPKCDSSTTFQFNIINDKKNPLNNDAESILILLF